MIGGRAEKAAPWSRVEGLERRGAQVLLLPQRGRKVDLNALEALPFSKKGSLNVLVEGALLWVGRRLSQEASRQIPTLYVAPMEIGYQAAPGAIDGPWMGQPGRVSQIRLESSQK